MSRIPTSPAVVPQDIPFIPFLRDGPDGPSEHRVRLIRICFYLPRVHPRDNPLILKLSVIFLYYNGFLRYPAGPLVEILRFRRRETELDSLVPLYRASRIHLVSKSSNKGSRTHGASRNQKN